MNDDPQRLITPAELAARLKLPEGTLTQWRYKGFGPPYVKVGRHVRYRPEAVATWLESRLRP